MVKKITMWGHLEPFLATEEYMHLAEVSRKLDRPHSGVRKYLNQLEKDGVLTKIKKGGLTMYKLNRDAPKSIDYMVIAEKEKLIRKCEKNNLISELVSYLHETLKENEKAVIFGSAAEDRNKVGDIDLLIAGEGKISDFEKKFHAKIHLITVKNLEKVEEHLKREIAKKHLIIQGSEEILRWLAWDGARGRGKV